LFWADEFFRSGRYLDREALQRFADAVLDTGPRWIWQLWAKGGMGKSMFLRWFIARRCVPDREGASRGCIPCARLDFDTLVRQETNRDPWRLLLKLAEQLNEQLPGAPLHGFITDLNNHRLLTSGRTGAGEEHARIPTEHLERFARALAEANLQRPVVLILD